MNNNKKHFESKKFTAFVVATSITVIMSLVGLTVMAIVPTIAAAVVNLLTVSLATLNALVSLYCIGQSAVDWKVNSQNTNKQENKIEEIQKFEMRYNDGV